MFKSEKSLKRCCSHAANTSKQRLKVTQVRGRSRQLGREKFICTTLFNREAKKRSASDKGIKVRHQGTDRRYEKRDKQET